MSDMTSAIGLFKISSKIKWTDAFVKSLMKIAECKPFLGEILTDEGHLKKLRKNLVTDL
jgi:hypothetical protein